MLSTVGISANPKKVEKSEGLTNLNKCKGGAFHSRTFLLLLYISLKICGNGLVFTWVNGSNIFQNEKRRAKVWWMKKTGNSDVAEPIKTKKNQMDAWTSKSIWLTQRSLSDTTSSGSQKNSLTICWVQNFKSTWTAIPWLISEKVN